MTRILNVLEQLLGRAAARVLSQARSASAAGMRSVGTLLTQARSHLDAQLRTTHTVECFGPDGRLKWREQTENLVTDVGLNDMLDKYLKGSGYTAAFFVGLKAPGTIAASNTMASHAGWAEVTAYAEANRPALTLGTVASKSVDNSAARATFTINADVTISGAFTATNSTKGGTAGVLYGASDFASNRAAQTGDSLQVTVTKTAAAV